MKFLKVIRGVEVDIEGHNYEYSPDINVVGFEYVTATDMDGKLFDLQIKNKNNCVLKHHKQKKMNLCTSKVMDGRQDMD